MEKSKIIIDKKICTIIFDKKEKPKYRFLLTIKLDNKENKDNPLIVIMFNPSNTGILDEKNTSYIFDTTVGNVVKIGEICKYTKLIILNLYPIINAKKNEIIKELNSIPKEVKNYNKNKIKEKLKNSNTPILLAYGNLESEERKKYANDLLKGFEDRFLTFCPNTTEYPLHPKNFNEKRCIKCHGGKENFLIKYYPLQN